MKLIECPYCHKKVYATRWQLMVKGRLSLVCPACRRFLFHAVRKRLLIMQTVMIFVAVILCAGLAQMNIPGGFFGKGFMNATQSSLGYLPEAPTDFIFCVLAEEFGFVGSIVLLVLYAGFCAFQFCF